MEHLALEKEIGAFLAEAKLTVAVAESCTGGLIGHRITSVSGSSRYFAGGVITYSNQAKIRELAVSDALLRKHGAVSEAVACKMAVSVRRKFRTDIGVAVTGIAGPGGGARGKPVGLVFVALASRNACIAKRFGFKGSRASIKNSSSRAALEILKRHLQQERGGS